MSSSLAFLTGRPAAAPGCPRSQQGPSGRCGPHHPNLCKCPVLRSPHPQPYSPLCLSIVRASPLPRRTLTRTSAWRCCAQRWRAGPRTYRGETQRPHGFNNTVFSCPLASCPSPPLASPLAHIRRCDSDGLTTASTQFIDDMEDQDTVVDRWAVCSACDCSAWEWSACNLCACNHDQEAPGDGSESVTQLVIVV